MTQHTAGCIMMHCSVGYKIKRWNMRQQQNNQHQCQYHLKKVQFNVNLYFNDIFLVLLHNNSGMCCVLCVCCVVVSFFCLFCLFLSQSNQIFSLFCHNLTSYILYIYYFLLFFNGTLIFLLFVFSFLSLLFSSFSF